MGGSFIGESSAPLEITADFDTLGISIEPQEVILNSFGECVLRWSVTDPEGDIESFIIVLEYFGVKSILDIIPYDPNETFCVYIDVMTSQFVGEKKYSIAAILSDGSYSIFPEIFSYEMISSIGSNVF